MMRYIKYLFRLIKHYGRHRLYFIRYNKSEDEHYHICYAARLLGEDLYKVCPFCMIKGFEPEHDDMCDRCKYFGILDFPEDSKMRMCVDERIIYTFK